MNKLNTDELLAEAATSAAQYANEVIDRLRLGIDRLIAKEIEEKIIKPTITQAYLVGVNKGLGIGRYIYEDQDGLDKAIQGR